MGARCSHYSGNKYCWTIHEHYNVAPPRVVIVGLRCRLTQPTG
ncbi:hypothetical protein [Okeania sp. SIO1I7]|nr:hypothetical protein [Okeania sp. SIO1I7]